MPTLPSWFTDPLWGQFAALIPPRRVLIQRIRWDVTGDCHPEAIADPTCSVSMIRNRRDEWIQTGVVAQLKQIALATITKAPGGGEVPGCRRSWDGGDSVPEKCPDAFREQSGMCFEERTKNGDFTSGPAVR